MFSLLSGEIRQLNSESNSVQQVLAVKCRGIVKTCGLACHHEVAKSVAGRERRCRRDQEPSLMIRSVAGTQPVTNGSRDCPGMRHTTTAPRLGILASRSEQ